MAASLFLLLDDVASVLDDVATLTKAAAAKTAGVVGDDLALNAKQLVGIASRRELPVVARVAAGSLVNKAILVPAALATGAWAPWAIRPLLIAGGAYLCFEGVEKLLHGIFSGRHPRPEAGRAASWPWEKSSETFSGQENLRFSRAFHARHVIRDMRQAVSLQPASVEPPEVGGRGAACQAPVAGAPSADEERSRIAGAIRTDFILSAEIIVIAMGIVAASPLVTQLLVLVAVALGMTVGVYGLVAAIVRLDDLGAALAGSRSATVRRMGRMILVLAPWLLRGLSLAGTAAMFLVGGGILLEGFPAAAHAAEALIHEHLDGAAGGVALIALKALAGLAAGGLLAAVVTTARRLTGTHAAR
jgi:predicted DNA repair protein MutK